MAHCDSCDKAIQSDEAVRVVHRKCADDMGALLTALKEIADSAIERDCVTGEGHEECIAIARAAIAKAGQ
jgi:hypothetical protein